MKKFVLSGLLILGCIALVGCQPEAAKKAANSDSKAPTSNSGIPASFAGEFNPTGLEIGSAIGQLAPEIEGNDLDGVPFKLSDYRGKVVMLDFYGDW